MIHKTAIVENTVKISKNVEIGPYSVIGPNVEIGENTIIQSHVNISGNVKIGKGNQIYPFVSINDPQDLKYAGEPTNLIIGDNNKIREYVTINPGTVGGGGKTVIGNNCLFMISSHIAHDCQVGNNVIIANNVPLGGHAIIEDNVVIGGNSAVQQFTRIGKMAMIGGMTGVLHDVIPYGLSTGNRNSLQGLNLIGLRRAKFENKDILGLSEAYKEIFATKNINENIKLNQVYIPSPLISDEDTINRLFAAVTPKTKAISFCHVTRGGHKYPVKKIAHIARKKGIATLVDGAQAVGQFPIDINDLGCDAYSASLHKWILAPSGTGFLFINKNSLK